MYFGQGGFHMNLNVLDKETLEDAMENPDKYPQLTIRVSGYAVNFVRLTRGAAAWTSSAAPSTARSEPDRRPCHRSARSKPAAGTTCASGSRPTRRTTATFETTARARSATRTPTRPSSRYDGPGLRVVLFLSGCLLRCQYCHNPDTWHLKDGTRVSVAARARPARQLCAGAARAGRRADDLRRRAAGADGVHAAHLRRRQGDGAAHRDRHVGLSRRPRGRRLSAPTSISCCSTSRARTRRPTARSPAASLRRRCASPSGWRRWASRSGSASRWCRG